MANNIYGQAPKFVNSSDLDGPDNIYRSADDGLRLLNGSPALNSGNNGLIPSGLNTDIIGANRISNTTVDIGPYEGGVCITHGAISAQGCDTFISPSGKSWTVSGTFLDTISNAANCDSIITVNLTVRHSTWDTINPDVCDSYSSPSGKIWSTTRTANDTIPNTAGCDSIITVNLTVRYTTFATHVVTAYDSLISPSGKLWTTSGTNLDTIPNTEGCDSLITFNLEIIHILFVDLDKGTTGNGSSWGSAFKTLDEAINAANSSGNTIKIFVKAGTYYPGGNSSHRNRDTSFVLSNPNTHLFGGFSGVETSEEQRNSAVNPTILCGNIGKSGDSTDNSYHVLIILDKRTSSSQIPFGPNFIIDGFTIRDGNADGNTKFSYFGKDVYQTEGGGLAIIGSHMSGTEISPIITNCHFENNHGDYGCIFISAPYGVSYANISGCTFKGNSTYYGTIFNDGSSGDVSPLIENCAFDGNTSATSGAAIYNYAYGGKASPEIENCVFNNNHATTHGGAIYNNGYAGTSSPTIFNSTFHSNEAGTSAGAMYNFGNSGTCSPMVTNSIFYKNTKAGDDDHKFSEFYNYVAYPYVSYSSMQRSSGTYTSGTLNSLNGGINNYYQYDPKFKAIEDGDGMDNVWRTGDDGLRLSDSSTLVNKGTNTGAPTNDILGGAKVGTRDMGAYEYITCGLNVQLATSVATHTASQAVNDGNYTCYCNSNNELLLALDTNGTGAVVTPSQVKLYIGNPSTLSYNSASGLITNTAGGVVLERRWDVDPTTQPTSPVTVRYFYTNADYQDIKTAMAALTSPTTISSPTQLQFYKVTGGSAATFPNPHNAGVTGIVLTHGAAPSTTVWTAGSHGVQDHTSEYLVSTFSGGGGGGGGGANPLPVELIEFEAMAKDNHIAQLDWKTASELDNSHFVLQRSYQADVTSFEDIKVIQGNGTIQRVIEYGHTDYTINPDQNTVFYRLKQVDFDGTEAYSPIRRVDFDEDEDLRSGLTKVYPNPTKGVVTISFDNDEVESHTVVVSDNIGRVLMNINSSGRHQNIELSDLPTGLYFITIDTGEAFKVMKQ